MKQNSVLFRWFSVETQVLSNTRFDLVAARARFLSKTSCVILGFALLSGCAGVTDDQMFSSESESMSDDAIVLDSAAALGGSDLIEGLPCDAAYAIMAPIEDEQVDACEVGSGATPCSEHPAGLVAYVIESEPAVGEESVHDGNGAGVELTALCGASAIGSEGGDAGSVLLDTKSVDQEISTDPSGEAVVGHAEQSPGFKQGIWLRLFSRERGWARKRGRLLVLSSPVIAVNVAKRAVGLSAPTHYFKILFDPNRRETLSFLIPHKALNAGSLGAFRSSIDRIENVTGIDFLAGLDDKLENRLEAQISTMW